MARALDCPPVLGLSRSRASGTRSLLGVVCITVWFKLCERVFPKWEVSRAALERTRSHHACSSEEDPGVAWP